MSLQSSNIEPCVFSFELRHARRAVSYPFLAFEVSPPAKRSIEVVAEHLKEKVWKNLLDMYPKLGDN